MTRLCMPEQLSNEIRVDGAPGKPPTHSSHVQASYRLPSQKKLPGDVCKSRIPLTRGDRYADGASRLLWDSVEVGPIDLLPRSTSLPVVLLPSPRQEFPKRQ